LISGGNDMSFMGLDNDIATLSVGKQPNREISVNTIVWHNMSAGMKTTQTSGSAYDRKWSALNGSA